MTKNFVFSRRSLAFVLAILIVAVKTVNSNYEDVRFGTVHCSVSIDKKKADCSHQRLLKIPQDLSASVEFLDLSNNQLDGDSLLRLDYLKNLRFLNLDGNKIRNVKYNLLPSLPSLETLLLTKNPFMVIEGNAFEKLPQLKILHLDHHNIISNGKILRSMNVIGHPHPTASLLGTRSIFPMKAKNPMSVSVYAVSSQSVITPSSNVGKRAFTTNQESSIDVAVPKPVLKSPFHVSLDKGARHIDPKVNLLSEVSYIVNDVAFKKMLSERKDLVDADERPVRRKRNVNSPASQLLTDAKLSGLAFKRESTTSILYIAVNVSFSQSSVLSLLSYFVERNSIILRNSSANILQNKTIAVPTNTAINIGLSVTMESGNGVIVQSTYDGSISNLSLSVGRSENNTWEALNSVDSGSERDFSYQFQFFEEGMNQLALIKLNFTSLEPISQRAKALLTLKEYIDTYEPLNIAFGTNYSHVEATWTLSSRSNDISTLLYRNMSFCSSTCPPSLQNCMLYTCILSMTYALKRSGNYDIAVDITNPVTSAPLSWQYNFTAEIRIRGVSIKSCDFNANVNQSKQFSLNYVGDNVVIKWFLNEQLIANDTTVISYTAASLGNYSLSAQLHNHDSSGSALVGVSVYPWGSVHGLSITEPAGGTYHATLKNVSFSSSLCAGEEPHFTWDFGDGFNETTTATSIKHAFKAPGEYTVTLKVRNSQNNTESKSLVLILQDEIRNLSVSLNTSIVGTDGYLHVITRIDKGTSVTYKVVKSDKEVVDIFKTNVSKSFLISNVGRNTLKVTAANEVSNEMRFVEVVVQERINLILIEDVYRELNKTQSFRVTRQSGTHMSTKWDFGDGSGTHWTYTGLTVPITEHTYENEGNYKVVLFARNDVYGEVNYSSLVFIERPLKDRITLTLPKYARTNVTFAANISAQVQSMYGYNVTVDEYTFLLTDEFHQVNKIFHSAGTFIVSLHAQNHVSASTRNGTITIQDPIAGELAIHPPYVPLLQPVRLYATVQGTDPMFTWNFKGQNFSSLGGNVLHVFSTLGAAHFNVTVGNKVSSVHFQLTIHVQLNITSLSLITNTSFAAIHTPISIQSSLSMRSEYVYLWKIDDLTLNQTGDKIKYAFINLGKHRVSLNLSNDISSQVATTDITVQEPIRGIAIQLPHNMSFILFNESVTLYAVMSSGSNMTFHWCIQSDCATTLHETQNTIVSGLGVLYLNATIIAENNVSKERETKLIPVVQRIEGLEIQPSSPFAVLVKKKVRFSFKHYTGNHFNVKWRVDGKLANSNETSLIYNFTQLGLFKVKVLLRNSINSQFSETSVTVQNPVKVVGIYPKFAETNQKVVFSTIDLAEAGIVIDWTIPGVNGSRVVRNLTVSLHFSSAGMYPLTVRGANLVDEDNKTFYIAVQDPVFSLNIFPKRIFYRTMTTAVFNASVTSGTNVSFAWNPTSDAGNVSCNNTDHPKVSCLLEKPGSYQLNVVASNLINSLSYSLRIYVQDAVDITNLTSTYGTILPTNEKLVLKAIILGTNFTASYSFQGIEQPMGYLAIPLLLRNPGGVKVMVTAKNEISRDERVFNFTAQERLVNVSIWTATSLVPVGEIVNFQAIPANGTDLTFAWYINQTKLPNVTGRILNTELPFEGTTEVKVTAKNGIINSFLSSLKYINVAKPECVPPKIAIHGGKQRQLFKSQWLYFEASIDYNCSTSSVTSSWLLKVAKDATNCLVESDYLETYALGVDVALSSTMLALQPGQIGVGIYCLYYTAKYGKNGRFIIFNASSLKVIPTPPIPVILGGTSKLIGVNQSFILDASKSIDPDNKEPVELLFQWNCTIRRTNTPTFALLHPGCNSTQWKSYDKGKRLYLDAGSLSLGYLYDFVLSVKKLGGTPYSTAQEVTVVSSTIPDVFITCVTCNSYKTSKYTSTRGLKLLGTCSNCNRDFGASVSLTINWLVIATNDTVILNITKSHTELTDLLVIQPGKLNGISAYTIRFSVEVSRNPTSYGKSEILLHPNKSPENGSCNITPQDGVTLKTTFTFNCSEWADSDNDNSPLLYWLKFQDSSGSWNVLYRGIRSIVGVYLPIGDASQQSKLRLQVLIEDVYGAQTVGLERMVTVKPPQEDATEFLNNNVISSIKLLTQESDLNKVVSVSQASAKLLKESGTIGTQQASIISNITESASQMSAPSLESVSQLSSALKSSVELVNEDALQLEARQKLTTSLEKMVGNVENFASKGQLAGKPSLESLLFLLQNNIASNTLRRANGRVRRAISQLPLPVQKNLNLAMQLYLAILRASIRGEDSTALSNKYGTAILKRDKAESLNKTLTADNCTFVLKRTLQTNDDLFQIFNTSFSDPFALTSPIESKIAGLGYLTTNGTQLTVKDLPVNESILIKLDGTPSRKISWSFQGTKVIKPKASADGDLILSGMNATEELLTVEIISSSGPIRSVDAYLKPAKVPVNGTAIYPFNFSIHGTLIKHFYTGEFNVSEKYSIKITNNNEKQDVNLSVLVFSSSCVFWDSKKEIWSSEGVTPTEETNFDFTVCRTTHLTSFASTFKIAPNPIRWSTLSDLNVEQNPVALAFCLTLIVLYLVGVFFSFRKDERDRQESHYIPMMGNDEFFKYEVRIKTGSFPGAGTSAHVGIQVYAMKCVTKPIVVAKKTSFQRNSVDIFRFASPTRLGDISRIRIWHDNSGSHPSWYLSRVVIKNLLDGQKYFFFCNRWLGVDRDDGEIERLFHVADSKMMSRFQTIFNDTIGRTFTDYHIWMSVFEKPKLSRFTRVQRLTCCVTFLLSWMCVDAMWYGTVRDNVDLYVGFQSYSYEEIIVGIISSLMVFPVNFVVVMIFRNCRLPPSRQILDGDDEIAIHVLSKSHRTRRLSEDWIEIEDATESHTLISSSLPRCGGYFRLMSFNQFPSYKDLQDSSTLLDISDRDSGEVEECSEESSNAVSRIHIPSGGFTQVTNLLQSGHQYSRLPVSYETNSEPMDDAEEPVPRQGSSRCSTVHDAATVSTYLTGFSSRTREQSASIPSEIEVGRGYGSRENSSEFPVKPLMSKYPNINDGIIRKRASARQSTGLHEDINSAPSHMKDDEVDDEELTRDLPDIQELDASLKWLLPSWFVLVAYLACLVIAALSILVILIYGQQFGRDKALSWLQSVLSGLLQDVFVTYPVLLVLVALFLAIIRKPMNLDYSDFVNCPVIPGDRTASSEPVRGYALELAQKQGRGKREIRRIVKNLAFQVVHLWLVLSICLTSYESHMFNTRRQFEAKMFTGKQGIREIDRISKVWQWMETDLSSFLYPASTDSRYWILQSTPRLRQVRIQSKDCLDSDTAKTVNNITTCNTEYLNADIEKREFLRSWATPGPLKNTPWSFKTEGELNGTVYVGRLGFYPHSGYSAVLGSTKSQLVAKVASLKAAGWLDSRTRALFLEFVLQNVNINRYAVATVVFEFSSTGLIIQQLEVLYLRIHMYITRLDNFRLFCEVTFGLLTFYQLWLIQDKLRRRGRKFFDKFWNLHLLVSFTINACTVGLSIFRLIVFLELRSFLKNGVPLGYDLRKAAIIDWSIQACYGFVCFILIIKAISLLSWTRPYRVIASALQRAIKHVFVITVGFILCLIAFASWGNLAFGSSHSRFHTFWRTLLYTMLFRIWDIDESDMLQNGLFVFWKILYTFIFFVFVLSFFRAALRACYKDSRLFYRIGHKLHHGEMVKYLSSRFALRKKKTTKRVKFSLNPPVPRNTLAMSQRTISLGSDQWLSSQSLSSFGHTPTYLRQQTLSQLNPITDEILQYVHLLEHDDMLEEEFYSRLESYANDSRGSAKRLKGHFNYR